MPMIIKNNVRYCSTGGDAENIVYDNAESGMEATNMQDAIDELNSNIGEDEDGMTMHEKLDNITELLGSRRKPEPANIVFASGSSVTYTPDWENYNCLYVVVCHSTLYCISRVYKDGTNELVSTSWSSGTNVLDVAVNDDGTFELSTTAGSVQNILVLPTNRTDV